MKKFFSIIALLMLAMGVVAGEASALSFDFSGGYELKNTDSDPFAELLSFKEKSLLQWATPDYDAVLDDGSYVTLSPFEFDEGAYISGVSYSFKSTPYAEGFKVYNSANELLMTADINVLPLKVKGGTGEINSQFAMNLTNVVVKQLGSPILDAFLNGGAVNFTINVASGNLAERIEKVPAYNNKGSYSASAAPVPEPSTVLLLGGGLLGMVAFGRKYMKK